MTAQAKATAKGLAERLNTITRWMLPAQDITTLEGVMRDLKALDAEKDSRLKELRMQVEKQMSGEQTIMHGFELNAKEIVGKQFRQALRDDLDYQKARIALDAYEWVLARIDRLSSSTGKEEDAK